MKLGVSPLLWMNDDDPALGADVPLERCLAEAREVGYAGIELGHRFPREPRALRALLARHRLALVTGWHSMRLLARSAEHEAQRLRPHLALLRTLGCDVLVAGEVTDAVHQHPRSLSSRPVMSAAERARFARELERLARHVRREGIRLAFHPHVGTAVETPDEIEQLVAETSDVVALALDTGHLVYGGDAHAPLARWVAEHGDRIAHVHLKDVRADVLARARERDLPFLRAVAEGVFTVPGDGALDLEPFVAALGRHRYRGWVVVEAEQDPARAHPLTYARTGLANVVRMVGRALRSLPSSRAISRRVRAGRAAAGGAPRARRPRPRVW